MTLEEKTIRHLMQRPMLSLVDNMKRLEEKKYDLTTNYDDYRNSGYTNEMIEEQIKMIVGILEMNVEAYGRLLRNISYHLEVKNKEEIEHE